MLRWAVATLVAGVAFRTVFVVEDCRENGASVCVCARVVFAMSAAISAFASICLLNDDVTFVSSSLLFASAIV